MKFLDVYGTDLDLTLTNFALTTDNNALVTGYNIPATSGISISAAYVFQFTSGVSNVSNVYLWIPVTTSPVPTTYSLSSPDVVDLISGLAPSNSLANFNDGSSLSAFNFFDLTDYNQWYTTVFMNQNTLLVSKFIYRVSTMPTPTSSSTSGTAGYNLNQLIPPAFQSATYGNKLCYASTETTQNVLHL